MQDWHPGSVQKKPRFLCCMQFDHDIATLSIQIIISLHRRLNISIETAFSHSFAYSCVVVIESMLFTLTESFRSVMMEVYEKKHK
jgi:hypothetical protein